MKVGVLALQGDFSKHIQMMQSLDVEAIAVRTSQDLQSCEGLIIPGGESTVIMRQIDFIGLRESLTIFAKSHPVFGTCAGLISISKQVQGSPFQSIPLLNIEVKRNAFGRQIDSFHTYVEVELQANNSLTLPAYFIRAPRIVNIGEDVQILGTYKGEPILVLQGHLLGATFHPELTDNPTIHQFFVSLIKKNDSEYNTF